MTKYLTQKEITDNKEYISSYIALLLEDTRELDEYIEVTIDNEDGKIVCEGYVLTSGLLSEANELNVESSNNYKLKYIQMSDMLDKLGNQFGLDSDTILELFDANKHSISLNIK